MRESDGALSNGKEYTLSRLYALRAGISVVAQEKEKADGIVIAAKSDKERQIALANARFAKAASEPQALEERLSGVKADIRNAERQAASPNLFKRILYVIIILPLKFISLFSLMYFVPIIAIIFGSLQCAYYGKETSDGFLKAVVVLDSDWGWQFIVGGIILAVILTAIYVKCKKIQKLDINPHWCSMATKRAAAFNLPMLIEAKKDLMQDIEAAEKKAINAKKQCDNDIAAANVAYEAALKDATEHAVAGLALIESLESAFSDLIDSRDWENVDIIIYAMETRRAENIKEALVVVDHERRTERIVESVENAGREICKSINLGLNKLQGEMTRCFGLLGKIVAVQGDRIAAAVQNLKDDVSAGNRYLAKLTTQASMNSALLAKSNENSSALVAEVSQLRTSVEYSSARTAYGGY